MRARKTSVKAWFGAMSVLFCLAGCGSSAATNPEPAAPTRQEDDPSVAEEVTETAPAQVSDATFQSETDRLYATAVEECYGRAASEPLVVEADVRVFDSLPEVLGNRTIEVLETSELVRRAGGGQVRIVVTLPIRIAGARLEVRLLNYLFSSPEPGALHYALGGGCSAQFVLTDSEYELSGIERGGV